MFVCLFCSVCLFVCVGEGVREGERLLKDGDTVLCQNIGTLARQCNITFQTTWIFSKTNVTTSDLGKYCYFGKVANC